MDNFEEKFLEELAKARARLEGKEPYDDAAIEREFDIEADAPSAQRSSVKKTVHHTAKEEKPSQKEETVISAETNNAENVIKADEKKTEKKKLNGEKLSVIWGGAAVAISFILSCLGLLVQSTSPAWEAFEAYMPFIGIVCGASAFICGALLIKNNKKGTLPLVLGLLAIFISVFISSISI